MNTLTAWALAATLAGLGAGSAGHEGASPAQPHALDGLLDVKSDPPAHIVIDDKDTGKITPDKVSLKPGHHTLLLVTQDGKRQRTIGFTVESNQVTRLSIHLKPEHQD